VTPLAVRWASTNMVPAGAAQRLAGTAGRQIDRAVINEVLCLKATARRGSLLGRSA
jgi:hypothetical protein